MLVLGVLILSSSASFGLGYFAGLDVSQAQGAGFETSPVAIGTAQLTIEKPPNEEASFVASKNGTKYYPIGCAGANRISAANKVWFASAELASIAGYAPAANCK